MSIFPFIDPEVVADSSSSNELPLFKEYAYDFAENKLLLDETGKTFFVEGNKALMIWIMKALTTPRFRFTAYSSDFGNEIEDNLVGKSVSEDIATLELERYIVEALMVNPYIQELNEFEFEPQQSGTVVTFACTSIYGKEKISFVVKGVGT